MTTLTSLLCACIAALASLLAAVWAFIRKAKADAALENAKQDHAAELAEVKAATEKELSAMKVAKDETDKVNSLSDDAAISELRASFTRD